MSPPVANKNTEVFTFSNVEIIYKIAPDTVCVKTTIHVSSFHSDFRDCLHRLRKNNARISDNTDTLRALVLSRFWGLPHRCKFRWVVDSTSAISKVQMVTSPGARPRQQPNNIDYLTLISDLTRELHRPISITWVKGHQDTLPSSKPLSRDAINNIAVDALATLHRTQCRLSPRTSIPHIPTMQVSVSVNGLRLTGHFNDMIRFHINGYHLRQYMQHRFAWSDHTWTGINHHIFGLHFWSLNPTQQVHRMKFVYDQQPLGVRLATRHLAPSAVPDLDRCPCCRDHSEDQSHFLRCQANSSRTAALRQLQKSLHSRDLHSVFYLLSFSIVQWLAGAVPPFEHWDLRGHPLYMHSIIRDALEEQERIGWLSGLKGFLSNITLGSMSMHQASDRNQAIGQTRIRHALHSFHIFSQSLWKGRNSHLHDSINCNTLHLTRMEDIEIKHYHDHPEFLATSDQHYCERPIRHILNATPTNRRRWLRQVKQARLRRNQSLRSQSLITQFFSRSQIPETIPAQVPVPHPPPEPPPRQMSLLDYFRFRLS